MAVSPEGRSARSTSVRARALVIRVRLRRRCRLSAAVSGSLTASSTPSGSEMGPGSSSTCWLTATGLRCRARRGTEAGSKRAGRGAGRAFGSRPWCARRCAAPAASPRASARARPRTPHLPPAPPGRARGAASRARGAASRARAPLLRATMRAWSLGASGPRRLATRASPASDPLRLHTRSNPRPGVAHGVRPRAERRGDAKWCKSGRTGADGGEHEGGWKHLTSWTFTHPSWSGAREARTVPLSWTLWNARRDLNPRPPDYKSGALSVLSYGRTTAVSPLDGEHSHYPPAVG